MAAKRTDRAATGPRAGTVGDGTAANRRNAAASRATAGRATAGRAGGSGSERLSRSELRDLQARAALVPLQPGERPGAVTVGAAVAAILGVLVIVGYLSGARVGGEGSLLGALFLTAVFFATAWGMWTVRYWAVLGFQALLAFQVVIASLSLMVASNWWAAILCSSLILFGGWLFWKLIRAMARIQMPERPSAR